MANSKPVIEVFERYDPGGVRLSGYRCMPLGSPRAMIYIAHGMGEHARRYENLMQALAGVGFMVCANDHRGHGGSGPYLGDFGENGWDQVLTGTREILLELKQSNPSLPLIFLGHSMGAMIAQQYLARWPEDLDAAVLSGSPGQMPEILYTLLLKVIRFECWRSGNQYSALLRYLIFGASNKPFKKEGQQTGFEWLSRDNNEVAKYAVDPLCGTVPNSLSLEGLFKAEAELWKSVPDLNRNHGFPIYLISGEDDPVHGNQRQLNRLIAWLQSGGARVDADIYPSGRHEMLNDINRAEVTARLINWLTDLITKMEDPITDPD
ncbi:MAG: alpha/beta fold hydrolase [Pseudomonadales bacterium]